MILHVITCLKCGGAQTLLYNLLSSMKPVNRQKMVVVSLRGYDHYGRKLEDEGVEVVPLRLAQSPVRGLFRLGSLLSRRRWGIVHTWMYHANLVTSCMGVFSENSICWSIHHVDPLESSLKKSTQVVAFVGSLLSWLVPKCIIVCSGASKKNHISAGYNPKKIVEIPNGVNVDRFKPSREYKNKMRSRLGIPNEASVIGIVGRYSPVKDHALFLSASEFLQNDCEEVFFVFVGDGMSSGGEVAEDYPNIVNLYNYKFIGRKENMEKVYPCFDICALSSKSESFPLVLVEAMACGVPCITTDVGSASTIVGDTGAVVKIRKGARFAQKCSKLLKLSDEDMSARTKDARKRILNNFSLKKMKQRYLNVYSSEAKEIKL